MQNSTSSSTSMCATSLQMLQRNSFIFKLNVATNDALMILVFVASVIVGMQLMKRSFFSDSATFIIHMSLLNGIIHEVGYAVIQNWSLWRAIVYSSDPCSIMFKENECQWYYRSNIFSRLLIICTYCAQAVDGLISVSRPGKETRRKQGIGLYILAVACSVALCFYITNDEPTEHLAANCLARLGRNLDDLQHQVNVYLFPIVVTCSVHFAVFCLNIVSRKKSDTVSSKALQKVRWLSAVVFLVVTLVQLGILAIYSVVVRYIAGHLDQMDPVNLPNWVLWSYTYTYCTFLYPIGISVSSSTIRWSRKKQMAAIQVRPTSTTTTNPVKAQSDAWEAEHESRHPESVIRPSKSFWSVLCSSYKVAPRPSLSIQILSN